MHNAEFLRLIHDDLEIARRDGTESVPVAAVQTYVAALAQALEKEPQALDTLAIERIKTSRDLALASLKQTTDSRLEMFRSVIAAGQSALRSSMAVNGLAATALLAFLGSVLPKQPSPGFVAAFALPLLLYISGVLAATMGYGANYVTQWLYSSGRSRSGNALNLLSVALTCGSYATFATAAWHLFRLFRSL